MVDSKEKVEIGKKNVLKVVRTCDFGVYLDGKGETTSEDILLPKKSIIGNAEVGDEVEVFIYRDSKDRIIATMKTPLAQVGDLCRLEVVDKSPIGYFVSIGLERDVLVPFKEVNYDMELGKSYLFGLYLDKTSRIAATTKVDKYLHNTNSYNVGEEIEGTVYQRHSNGNLLVALENTFRGIILKKEYFTPIEIGDELKLRVKKYFEDGTVEVTPRKPRLEERDELECKILNYLKEKGGKMEFNDKSSPEDIKRVFNASKNAFKRALGGLMKKGSIEQGDGYTKLK